MLDLRASDAAVTARSREEGESDPVGGRTGTGVGARATGVENINCWLYEPDGAILSAGLVRTWDVNVPCRVQLVALHWPGQIVLRCLVGDVREVTLELAWGTCLPARVVRVRYDRTLGRTCELHLTSVCREWRHDARGEDEGNAARPGPP